MAFTSYQEQTLQHNPNNNEQNFREINPTEFPLSRSLHLTDPRVNELLLENDRLSKKIQQQERIIAKNAALSSKNKELKAKVTGLHTSPSAFEIEQRQPQPVSGLWKHVQALEDCVTEYEKKFDAVQDLLMRDLSEDDKPELLATIQAIKTHLGMPLPSSPSPRSTDSDSDIPLALQRKDVKRKRDLEDEEEHDEEEIDEEEYNERKRDDMLDLYRSSSETDDDIEALFRPVSSRRRSRANNIYKLLRRPHDRGYYGSKQDTANGDRKRRTFRSSLQSMSTGEEIHPLSVGLQQLSNPEARPLVGDVPNRKRLRLDEQATRANSKPVSKLKRKL